MYDWANSVYATNIMAAIYPTIFASQVPNGDIRWGYATSFATLVVALLAPILGSIADYKGMKKKLFTLFMLLGVIFTPLMVFTGNWQIALIGYVVSRIGFSGSCLFYDSFLTDVTTNERMDKVSSWGYAMGYIGGSTIPFVISIAVLLVFDYSAAAMAFSVLIVSVWWLLFSIPMLKNVSHEHYVERNGKISIGHIFTKVLGTLKSICSNKGLLLFILAYFFYIDGVDTIINISTAYGTILGLGATGMILALLVTQLVAMPCSILFAKIADKISARKALICAVAVYFFVTMVGFYMGFSMEPSQTAYEEVFDSAAVTVEFTDEYRESVDKYVSEWKSEFKSSSPDLEKLGKMTIEPLGDDTQAASVLTQSLSSALKTAADSEPEKLDAFRSAIGFSSILFWAMAFLVGTVQGGIQAVSRSYYGKLIPKERSNEYYGFFDIFGKFASFLGPVIYAVIAQLTGRSSMGVLGLAVLFIAGLVLLIASRKPLEDLEKHAG